MPSVTVKLFATLEKYKPYQTDEPTVEVRLSNPKSVEQLAVEMGVPLDLIRTISVNESIVNSDHIVKNGDYIVLFPTIAGG